MEGALYNPHGKWSFKQMPQWLVETGSLLGKNNSGNLLCGETEMAYKNSWFVSNKASSVDFHKLKGSEVNTFSKLQQQGFKAFVKNVWNQEQQTIRFEQGDMGL